VRTRPPTPTQVQAHRYVTRRLRSALVGRDPTPGRDPGRDPGRTQSRALTAGAVLAVLGVGVAAIVGLVRGDTDWRAHAVVRGEPSGALYVVAHAPDRLVPTLNLASARLLAAVASGAASAGGSGAVPVAVRDDALADVARTAPAGIPGAPAVLPGPDVGAAGTDGDDWAICDTVRVDPSVPDPQARPARATVVLGGVGIGAGPGRLGRALAPEEALLARGDDGVVWLVIGGRRARVDPRQGAVLQALDLSAARPRVAAAGFLGALPEAPPLAPVVVPGAGSTPADAAVRALGVPVGSVVTPASPPGPAAAPFLLVLRDGVQEVPAVLAQLTRFTDPDPRAAPGITAVPAAALAAAPRSVAVDLSAYPSVFPRPVDYDAAPVVCAHPDAASGATTVTASDTLGSPAPPTPVVDAPGVDGALVVGAGAYVVPVGPGLPGTEAPPAPAGLVVDPGGRAFAVPSPEAADALGLGSPRPAPRAVTDLLPRGPALDPATATLMW